MAARKKTAAAKKTTTTTVEEAPQLNETAEELDVFERARAQFSDTPRVKITIYRYDDGETSYLKRVEYIPDTIDEEWIRKKWGPGSYQLRFLDSENPQLAWSKVIQIAADVPPHSQPQGSGGFGESSLVAMLQRQNEIMLTALVGVGRGGGGGGGAPAGGSEALVKLIEGMQAQNTELLRASLNRPDTSATMLTVFEKGLQIAADAKLDGEGGWMAQLGRVAREMMPAFQEMAKMRATMPPPSYPVPPGVTPTAPRALPAVTATRPNGGTSSSSSSEETAAGKFVSTTPATAAPNDEAVNMLDEAVRGFAPDILKAVQAGAKPADVADAILGAVPPMFYPEFEKLTPESVIVIEPQLTTHRQFLVELIEALKDDGGSEEGGSDAAG